MSAPELRSATPVLSRRPTTTAQSSPARSPSCTTVRRGRATNTTAPTPKQQPSRAHSPASTLSTPRHSVSSTCSSGARHKQATPANGTYRSQPPPSPDLSEDLEARSVKCNTIASTELISFYVDSFQSVLRLRKSVNSEGIDTVAVDLIEGFLKSTKEIVDSLRDALILREKEVGLWHSEHAKLRSTVIDLAAKLRCSSPDSLSVHEALHEVCAACSRSNRTTTGLPAEQRQAPEEFCEFSEELEYQRRALKETSAQIDARHAALTQREAALDERETMIRHMEDIARTLHADANREAQAAIQEQRALESLRSQILEKQPETSDEETSSATILARERDICCREQLLVARAAELDALAADVERREGELTLKSQRQAGTVEADMGKRQRNEDVERELQRRAEATFLAEVQVGMKERQLQELELTLSRRESELAKAEQAHLQRLLTLPSPTEASAIAAAANQQTGAALVALSEREQRLASQERQAISKEIQLCRWEMDIKVKEAHLNQREMQLRGEISRRHSAPVKDVTQEASCPVEVDRLRVLNSQLKTLLQIGAPALATDAGSTVQRCLFEDTSAVTSSVSPTKLGRRQRAPAEIPLTNISNHGSTAASPLAAKPLAVRTVGRNTPTRRPSPVVRALPADAF